MSFEHDTRVIVYPHYINKAKSVSEGRRIPKEKACDNPTSMEILDCIVNGLKLQAEVEDKHYPRDWLIRGRVRVRLRNPDGSPCDPAIPSRRELLLAIAQLVPRHPSRANGKAPPTLEQQIAAVLAQTGTHTSGGAGTSKAAASSSSKKKSSKKK